MPYGILIFLLIFLMSWDSSVYTTELTIGFECSEEFSCFKHQVCHHGFCRCLPGYIRKTDHCFKVRTYNETCFFDEQCDDYLLVCSGTENGRVARCVCTKYFAWDDLLRRCKPVGVEQMIRDMNTTQYDTYGTVERQSLIVFTGLVWAGLSVIILGLALSSGCIFYGCCYHRKRAPIHRPSQQISSTVGLSQQRPTASETPKSELPEAGPSQSTSMLQEGTVDYVPGLYQGILP